MKKRIMGALTFVVAVGGVIYMKNNPKYKEIVKLVKNADARGFYEKAILKKDKFAFTTKAKISDYKIDYESIKSVGEKIFARLIINNNEKLSIDTTMLNNKCGEIDEIKCSEELNSLLEEK